jgi:serine/threonine protein kinase
MEVEKSKNSKITSSNEKPEEITINNKFIFQTSNRIKTNSISNIFKGINKKSNEEIIIKIISEKTEFHNLIHEYSILKNFQECENFPKIFYYSKNEENIILITNYLGKNLEELIKIEPTKHFSLKTTLMLSIKIIEIIKIFHEKNYIHRNIKPENFLIGKSNLSKLNLIGFNLSKHYKKNNIHISYKNNKSLIGTLRFSSIYSHFGFEQSRRDDLISLGYMIIYFIKGNLPWIGIKSKNIKEKINRIKEKKIEVTPNILCQNINFNIQSFFDYVLKLKFSETPNYEFLINLFLEDLKIHNFNNDLIFDWCERKSISFNNNSNKFYNGTFGSQINFSTNTINKNKTNNYHQFSQESIIFQQNNQYNQYYQKNKSVEISFEQTK